jgi:hypothetical protein
MSPDILHFPARVLVRQAERVETRSDFVPYPDLPIYIRATCDPTFGKVFTTTSTGAGPHTDLDPTVKDALGGVPEEQRPTYHGCCAEPANASNAIKAKVNPRGGTAVARSIRKVGHPQHGALKKACPSCRHMNKKVGINQLPAN